MWEPPGAAGWRSGAVAGGGADHVRPGRGVPGEVLLVQGGGGPASPVDPPGRAADARGDPAGPRRCFWDGSQADRPHPAWGGEGEIP
ncbi:MAG: hypothetical protein PHC68_18900 [Syntrophorhabdaceae bacterium]|nr:hypothetical protein [Syntrophorhabdaceae bacterium]